MRKLIFILAFALIGSFAFASNEVKPVNENVTVENILKMDTSKTEEVLVEEHSIQVTFSCGKTTTMSWSGTITMASLIQAIMYYDDLLC